MSEYINNEIYINDRNSFNKATKNWSEDSINALFDVNEDGELNGIEKDRMQSMSLLNTLSSIHPAVAKVYNDVNFQINQGTFLTKKQINNGQRFLRKIQELSLKYEQDETVEHQIPIPENLNIVIDELDTDDLREDIENRRFLTQGQLDNAQ